jgi:hypothetical protein
MTTITTTITTITTITTTTITTISIARIMDMNRHVFDLLELKKENLGSLTDSLTHRLAHCMTH